MTVKPINNLEAQADISFDTIIKERADELKSLRAEAVKILGIDIASTIEPYHHDYFYTRFIIREPDSHQAQLDLLRGTLKWRLGKGAKIVAAGLKTINLVDKDESNSDGTLMDYETILSNSPNYDKIKHVFRPEYTFLYKNTEKEVLQYMHLNFVDIHSPALKNLTSAEFCEIMTFLKEVNILYCFRESIRQNRLVKVTFVLDMNGANLLSIPSNFRQGMTNSAKIMSQYYPRVSGLSISLNLPVIMNFIVKIIVPMFPKRTRQRFVFARVLPDIESPLELRPGSGKLHKEFCGEIDKVMYGQQ